MIIVSNPVWKEGADLYVLRIFNIVFAKTNDAEFARDAAESVWVHFCDNEYHNGLMEGIGTPELLDQIVAYTIAYCRFKTNNISN